MSLNDHDFCLPNVHALFEIVNQDQTGKHKFQPKIPENRR